MSGSAKQTHPSADRNSQPISEALREKLDRKTPGLRLLEIASGSGQHVGYLAPLFTNIIFQPTEYSTECFNSIAAYAADCSNVLQPLYVDVSTEPEEWELHLASYDYILNCNMMHISPWECSVGLFRAAGAFLKPGGSLFTYGPYAVDGKLEPESNVQFDQSLRARNPNWGVRDIKDLEELAADNCIDLDDMREMPSNNKFLTWIKRH